MTRSFIALALVASLLVPVAASADDPDRESAVTADASSGGWWTDYPAWLAVGTGLVLWGIHFVLVAPRINELNDDPGLNLYRASEPPSNRDVCASAAPGGARPDPHVADICDEADTLTTIGPVLLLGGLGAVVSGMIALAIYDDPADDVAATRLRLTASAAPTGGAVGLHLRF